MTERLGGDRRAIFLVVAGLICLVLYPVTPDDPKHHIVKLLPIILAIWCGVLALLSWLDHWSRQRQP